MFTIGFVYLLVLSVIAGCTTTGKAISGEDFFKTWSGTWVNTDLPGTPWIPQKIVAYPDGTHDLYVFVTDSLNHCHHRIALIDQWTDLKGNIWYTASWEHLPDGNKGYEYGKISNSGNTLEHMYHASDNPIEKWEPDNWGYHYCIYYRED